jgi:hypothetical protein
VTYERFVAFNKARGNVAVPAGFLLGFMRKWRSDRTAKKCKPSCSEQAIKPGDRKVMDLARPAPFQNRHFHQSDLERLIGREAYNERIRAMQVRLSVMRYFAALAVHGEAVKASEIDK